MGVCLIESMVRHIGQTVTVFTTSGGLSGNGFTGVLAGICDGCVRLITDIGAPPACPLGSSCCGGFPIFDGEAGFEGRGCNCRGSCRCNNRCGRGIGGRMGFNWNWLGSVTEIPVDKIVSFTHNAI